MRNLQHLIPIAIEAIEITTIANSNKQVDKQFKGYVSSFGGAIISSGLLPAVVFFSQKGGSETERPKIIKAINYVINKQDGGSFDLLKETKELYSGNIDINAVNMLTEKVEQAIIALKLAIRIFEPTEQKSL